VRIAVLLYDAIELLPFSWLRTSDYVGCTTENSHYA
jgi:hypothetical protein